MPETNIAEIDKNLVVATTIDVPDLELHDIRKPPFQIYGLYNPLAEPVFKRMPTEVAEKVNDGVLKLHTHTAGGRVRFATDSPYIVIKAVMPKITHFSHMPLTGSSGFDLYIDTDDGSESVYHRTFVPPHRMTDGYESKVEINAPGMHCYTVNFPLYNPVDALYIGIAKGSGLSAGAPYRDYPPVVYYGNSVTQGGCASRPGNSFEAMVGRALNLDHVNLGFSGSGLAEDTIVAYMAGMKMSAFVADYDHNALTVEHLRNTHCKMYRAIRAAHPHLPILLLSRPDFYYHNKYIGGAEKSIERRRVILDTYNYAIDQGDRSIYFIDGERLHTGTYADCCTVDGGHPNDLGFMMMAEQIGGVLRRILREGKLQK
ncbi:MAG: SGNH/GDSL hydrolase family protein [Clostridia bacterium]|nr:SGNH/GDSL hydrolase family protein [Clostridia bacterium]